MSEALSKKDLLKSSKQTTEEFTAKQLGLEETLGEGTIRLRGLTDSEWDAVEEAAVAGLTVDAGMDEMISEVGDDASALQTARAMSGRFHLDLGAMVAGDARAAKIAAAFGLSGEERWSPEEVGRLPHGVPERIAAEVYRLTGIEGGPGQAAQARFRGGESSGEEPGGAADDPAAHDGLPTGDDSAGDDSASS